MVVRLSSNHLLTNIVNISLLADSLARCITSRHQDCHLSKGLQKYLIYLNLILMSCDKAMQVGWKTSSTETIRKAWDGTDLSFLDESDMNPDDLRNCLNTGDIWEHESWTDKSRISWCSLDTLACCQLLPASSLAHEVGRKHFLPWAFWPGTHWRQCTSGCGLRHVTAGSRGYFISAGVAVWKDCAMLDNIMGARANNYGKCSMALIR